jgi:hypothetical protein
MKLFIKLKIYFIFIVIVCFYAACVFSFEMPCPQYEKGKLFYYNSCGILNHYDRDFFVISDKVLKKSASVSYHGLKFRHINEKNFKKGCIVGLRINKKNEVTDIYLIKNNTN